MSEPKTFDSLNPATWPESMRRRTAEMFFEREPAVMMQMYGWERVGIIKTERGFAHLYDKRDLSFQERYRIHGAAHDIGTGETMPTRAQREAFGF